MSTEINPTPNTLLSIDDEPAELRQFVIYAASVIVTPSGTPVQEIPLDLIEDDEDGGAVARAMVAASELYTADDGWLIERRDAATVPTDDMRRLAERLGDEWDEYIGVDCQLCGDTGFVETCGDVDGACVTMQGDCPDCGAN